MCERSREQLDKPAIIRHIYNFFVLELFMFPLLLCLELCRIFLSMAMSISIPAFAWTFCWPLRSAIFKSWPRKSTPPRLRVSFC